MKKRLTGILLLLAASLAMAGNNATPLGLEVGTATYAQAQAALGKQVALEQEGTNKYTGGRMVKADGAGLDIDGLHTVLLIFNKADVLEGVVLTMNKDPKGIYKALSQKYQTVSNRIDTFMNNGYATLQKGNSFIEIDAPHMSFEMEVRYVTKPLMDAYGQAVNSENAAKQQKKANAL